MKNRPLLISFTVFVLFMPRFIVLHADPSSSIGLSFILDEGWWLHNARNAVLFGSFILDDFNQGLVLSPAYTLCVYVCFKLFGIGFFSARLVSALAGLGTLIITFLWFRQDDNNIENNKLAYFAVILMGWNFFLISFNRIGLTESLLLFFGFAGIYFFCQRKVFSSFLAGLFLSMAMLVNSSFVFIYLVILSGWYYEWQKKGANWYNFFPFFIGSVPLIIFWFYALYPTYWDQYVKLMGYYCNAACFHSWYQNPTALLTLFFWYNSHQLVLNSHIAHNALLIIVTFWISLNFVNQMIRKGVFNTITKLNIRQFITASWAFIGILLLLFNQYKPERRFLFLLLPLILIVSEFVSQCFTSRNQVTLLVSDILGYSANSWSEKVCIGLVPAPFAILLTPITFNTFFSARTVPNWRMWSEVIFCIVFLLVILALVSVSFHHYWRYVRLRLRTLGILFLVLYLLFHTIQQLDYFSRLNFSLYKTSHRLSTKFSKETVVIGKISDTLCLETEAFSFSPYISCQFNLDAPQRFKPDYYLKLHQINDFILPNNEFAIFENLYCNIDQLQLLPDRYGKSQVFIDVYSNHVK